MKESDARTGLGAAHEGSALGAARWLTIHDDLLRGLAHAIGNRLGTITATAGLLEGGRALDARFVAGLQQDATRLEGLLETLRLLPHRVDAEAEPLLLDDALDGARRLVAEHPLLHDRQVEIVRVGDVPPVRAPLLSVTQACAVAILTAARLTTGATITLTLTVDAEGVCLHAGAGERTAGGEQTTDELLEHDARAITWLLAAHGGRGSVEPLGETLGCVLRLPALVLRSR